MSSGYSQQSIIHSKHAKYGSLQRRVEKKKGDATLGRLIKGNLAFETTKISRGRSHTHSKQIIQEIEYVGGWRYSAPQKQSEHAAREPHFAAAECPADRAHRLHGERSLPVYLLQKEYGFGLSKRRCGTS